MVDMPRTCCMHLHLPALLPGCTFIANSEHANRTANTYTGLAYSRYPVAKHSYNANGDIHGQYARRSPIHVTRNTDSYHDPWSLNIPSPA